MSGWTWAWLFWGAMFFAIEMPAVFNKTKGDTLSEHIWHWFSIRDKGKWWRVRRAVLAFALAILTYHFLAGGGWLVF
jgi:hypothetical protein